MKITLPVIGLALLVGLLLSIGFWTWDVTHQFDLGEHWLTSLAYALSHTFQIKTLRPIALWSLFKGFVPAIGALFLLDQLDDRDRNQRFIGGARLVSAKELMRKTRVKPSKDVPAQVTIGGVPMPADCETSHLLFVGSTGKGKTTVADEVLVSALQRGDRAIVIDPNGHAWSRFGCKGDVLLNPFDTRSPGWNIFREFRKPYDFQRFAKSVIPHSADQSEQQWREYAQQLFAQTAHALTQTGETTHERLVHWLTQAPAADLKALLAGSAAAGLFEPGAEKALGSTRYILTSYLDAFQHLQPGDFSLRDWLEKGKGNLYITWRQDMLSILKPLVSAWTDILISSILSMPDHEPRRLWLMLDELGSLERLSSLEDGLTKGRKHGLRVTAGLQAISQLAAIYGVHHATTLRSCFLNLCALGGSNCDPDTAEEISKGLGKTIIERVQINTSQGKHGPVTSKTYQRVDEPLVSTTDLMNLPPLHGYLKFAGSYPVGKILLTLQDYRIRAKPFMER